MADEESGVVNLAELAAPSPAERRSGERGFRRGYRSGWVQAIDALHGLVAQHGLPFQEAYEACHRHWEAGLMEWARGGQGYLAPPVPRPPRPRRSRRQG